MVLEISNPGLLIGPYTSQAWALIRKYQYGFFKLWRIGGNILYMIDDRIMTRGRQPSEIAGTWFRPGRPAGDVIMVKNGKSSARKKSR